MRFAQDQGREGGAQGLIESVRPQGAARQDRLAVFEHPGQSDRRCIGRFAVAGFWIGFIDRPGAVIDAGGQGSLGGRATGVAAAHLGRQVVGVGVEVALGAEVGGALLQRCKPAIDGRVFAAHQKSLVVGQACRHPLHVGHEHQIGRAQLPQ